MSENPNQKPKKKKNLFKGVLLVKILYFDWSYDVRKPNQKPIKKTSVGEKKKTHSNPKAYKNKKTHFIWPVKIQNLKRKTPNTQNLSESKTVQQSKHKNPQTHFSKAIKSQNPPTQGRKSLNSLEFRYSPSIL